MPADCQLVSIVLYDIDNRFTLGRTPSLCMSTDPPGNCASNNVRRSNNPALVHLS